MCTFYPQIFATDEFIGTLIPSLMPADCTSCCSWQYVGRKDKDRGEGRKARGWGWGQVLDQEGLNETLASEEGARGGLWTPGGRRLQAEGCLVKRAKWGLRGWLEKQPGEQRAGRRRKVKSEGGEGQRPQWSRLLRPLLHGDPGRA